MIYSLPIIICTCLITTIIIESLFSFLLKVRDKSDYINIILANIVTNPLVVTIPFYINLKYGLIYRNINLCLLEIWAIWMEGKIYQKYLIYQKINPYLLSLLLNGCSYLVGIMINSIIY